MLKLTLMLSAAIYAGLVIYSDGGDTYSDGGDTPAAEAPVVTQAAARTAPALIDAGGDMTLTTSSGAVLQIAAVINPADMSHSEFEVIAVSTYQPDTVTASASSAAPEATLPRVQVTGNTVNLRDGPSTNTQVIGSLTRGAEAYLVQALGNGWAQIRVAETGVEGFMADRFLAQVN